MATPWAMVKAGDRTGFWRCEVGDFEGTLSEMVAHVVKNQFLVKSGAS